MLLISSKLLLTILEPALAHTTASIATLRRSVIVRGISLAESIFIYIAGFLYGMLLGIVLTMQVSFRHQMLSIVKRLLLTFASVELLLRLDMLVVALLFFNIRLR